MSYIPKTIDEIITENVNHTTFLPAIQREFVWSPYAIEKLFDSIMGDYPISTFLFWKIREENKNEWTAYEFIRDYDAENPHNKEANVAGINQDIYLVLDGQQRLTSLFIGLKGSYRYFYRRWRKEKLYLNILKPVQKNDDPEEFVYQFKFRENAEPDLNGITPQYWYLVGDILNFDDAEDAKRDIKDKLSGFSDELKDVANTHIGRIHSRIKTMRLLNYYEEKSQDYDKVVEAFIRANTGGVKLEYSDILLSTATAKWDKLNAREEINIFTDAINEIGGGYSFGKDFVLKGCLYLTENLPIQYKVGNFTKSNLLKIENNWENIKNYIELTVKLVNKFGFNDKNIVSKMALLPIALYLKYLNPKNYINSTNKNDVNNQILIQKWLIICLLKNVFGGSSDTTLRNLQDVISKHDSFNMFPSDELNKRLNSATFFTDSEIENLLLTNYGTKYSFLILSLIYPDRDWKDKIFHEDHIFPKSEFSDAKLKQRKYDDVKIEEYRKYYNTILNLQLLTDSENLEKTAQDFSGWITTRDINFKSRHMIPNNISYNFDDFLDFIKERKELLLSKIKSLSI
jgi:uncharacterized protein with ParB-like and HNH nuclease domain